MAATQTLITQSPVTELKNFLVGGHAHATFEQAMRDVPESDRGRAVAGLPYSLWQLLEHIRFTQADILEFSRSSDYKEKEWPKDYWPDSHEPPSREAWDNSISAIAQDRDEFVRLLEERSDALYEPFPWGDGQTLIREALLIIDHNSHHLGEIIALRRALGNWKKVT